MKTIGVLGGMGPQATMDFEARVHEVSRRLIPQAFGMGYPPMVVVYNRHPPVVLDENYKPVVPWQPNPNLLEASRKLGQVADFIVITSNAPHLMRDYIEEASGLKVLSMIELVLDEVRRRGWRRVGVLGLGDPMVHRGPLDSQGIPYEVLSGETGGLRDRLDGAIRAVMEGQDGPEESAIAREAVDTLRARGVDGVVLGCTEIPLLLRDATNAPDLINPAQLLAEAAVRFAIE
jgi:aspartate racemase